MHGRKAASMDHPAFMHCLSRSLDYTRIPVAYGIMKNYCYVKYLILSARSVRRHYSHHKGTEFTKAHKAFLNVSYKGHRARFLNF